MTTITALPPDAAAAAWSPSAPARRRLDAIGTLARRRFALSARTPREILVPLLTPILFAVVIAPALAKSVDGSRVGFDYTTFVAIATIGLLVPISCMFSGLGVIVARDHGAQRELLAAPVPRSSSATSRWR